MLSKVNKEEQGKVRASTSMSLSKGRETRAHFFLVLVFRGLTPGKKKKLLGSYEYTRNCKFRLCPLEKDER